jgi:hypothetical protein
LTLAVVSVAAFLVIATMSPKPRSAAMIAVFVMAYADMALFVVGVVAAIVGGIGYAFTRSSANGD